MARIEQVNIDGTNYDVGKLASTTAPGVVQVGAGLAISSGGVLSASGVTSFNGLTGAVTYTAPVTSVNGSTGAVTGLQTTSNLVTSVSSSSTNSQYPSAKLFYDTVGNVESVLQTLNSGTGV